jgi:hypothetical protein
MLEREAKFSTLGTESKVTFEQMPKLLESREAMLKAVDSTIPHAREVVTHFEADHVVSKESLESLKVQLATLQEIVTASSGSESFEAVKVRLTELKQKIDEVAVLTVADFEQGAQSVGYLKIQPLMQALYDWNTALERDVVNFKAGVHALSVAQLADVVAKTEAALKPIQNEESITKWVSLHNEDARKVGEAITTAIAKVSESATDQAFASVREDLGDLKNLLMDLSKVFPTPLAEAYPSTNEGKSEKALVVETVALASALGADLQRELTNTLGVQKPDASIQTAKATAPSGSGNNGVGVTEVHHHHSSGNNMMLWYMLFNNNRGYDSGYSYVPNHAPMYSGATRLRSSPEYASFSKASEASHSTLTGHSNFTSHTSGPLGRSTPSVSSGGFGKSSSGVSSSSHSSRAGHVGGFNSGRSSSAGFGG